MSGYEGMYKKYAERMWNMMTELGEWITEPAKCVVVGQAMEKANMACRELGIPAKMDDPSDIWDSKLDDRWKMIFWREVENDFNYVKKAAIAESRQPDNIGTWEDVMHTELGFGGDFRGNKKPEFYRVGVLSESFMKKYVKGNLKKYREMVG